MARGISHRSEGQRDLRSRHGPSRIRIQLRRVECNTDVVVAILGDRQRQRRRHEPPLLVLGGIGALDYYRIVLVVVCNGDVQDTLVPEGQILTCWIFELHIKHDTIAQRWCAGWSKRSRSERGHIGFIELRWSG